MASVLHVMNAMPAPWRSVLLRDRCLRSAWGRVARVRDPQGLKRSHGVALLQPPRMGPGRGRPAEGFPGPILLPPPSGPRRWSARASVPQSNPVGRRWLTSTPPRQLSAPAACHMGATHPSRPYERVPCAPPAELQPGPWGPRGAAWGAPGGQCHAACALRPAPPAARSPARPPVAYYDATYISPVCPRLSAPLRPRRLSFSSCDEAASARPPPHSQPVRRAGGAVRGRSPPDASRGGARVVRLPPGPDGALNLQVTLLSADSSPPDSFLANLKKPDAFLPESFSSGSPTPDTIEPDSFLANVVTPDSLSPDLIPLDSLPPGSKKGATRFLVSLERTGEIIVDDPQATSILRRSPTDVTAHPGKPILPSSLTREVLVPLEVRALLSGVADAIAQPDGARAFRQPVHMRGIVTPTSDESPATVPHTPDNAQNERPPPVGPGGRLTPIQRFDLPSGSAWGATISADGVDYDVTAALALARGAAPAHA